jgi:hypothetical protein
MKAAVPGRYESADVVRVQDVPTPVPGGDEMLVWVPVPLGDRYYEARTLTKIVDAHSASGKPTAARDAGLQALAILEDLGHPELDLGARGPLTAIPREGRA